MEEVDRWSLPGLSAEVYVLRTEGSIPYIYAEDRVDLARATGFVVARDRFFMIDMIRRLSKGTLSEILGDEALSVDQESRSVGMARVAARMTAEFESDPLWSEILSAYADGVNAYIAEVNSNRMPVPSEYASLGPILGQPDPKLILQDFALEDMAAIGATFIYELGFETKDVGRQASYDALADHYVGAAFEDLRTAGLFEDVWSRVEPVHDTSSSAGWAEGAARSARTAAGQPRDLSVPSLVLDRLTAGLDRIEARLGHDHEGGFGSNAWAVAGTHTADGRSLMAGDGHLPLSIPSLFYSMGMDTTHLGGGDLTQVGLVIPGLPTLAVGTNGQVAWGQTQLFGDITDWYADELQLDGDGRPSAARFQGSWEPLVEVEESYVIADVPLLGSVGRTEVWSRWETADGRLITEIEGLSVPDDHVADPGEAVIQVMGNTIVPQDIDGDGVISAVSFDHTGLDSGNLVLASDGFGNATDVEDFRQQTRRLVAYSQNIIASDADGGILYTGYQAVPCRDYLPRNPDGTFVAGADPSMLLDGTQYRGFEIPTLADGRVDETDSADPYRCTVPFDAYPQAVNPAEGYVLTANNDPGNISTDGDLYNDPYYIGGPWLEGFRADRIDGVLAEQASAGTATLDSMATLQGDHRSNIAALWLPTFLDAVVSARDLSTGTWPKGSSEARIAQQYLDNVDRFEEVETRLTAWFEADVPARAGVETFYMSVEDGDLDHAVATMIWNTWAGHAVRGILDDEGWSGVYVPTSDSGRTRTLARMFAGRGPGNPEGMASWDPILEESVFFDDLATLEVETSTEILVRSLVDALDLLTAPATATAEGGFGTDDMDAWLWGLRHLVKFESLLAEVLDADDDFGFIIDLFSINTDVLPLADSIPGGDPRAGLPWFPRHGDHLNVDAGNTGFATEEFMYTSGPVFRMVVALGPEGAEGINMLPGGQSGIKDSPYWSDQAEKWLANDTWPMHTDVEDAIAAATGRETLTP